LSLGVRADEEISRGAEGSRITSAAGDLEMSVSPVGLRTRVAAFLAALLAVGFSTLALGRAPEGGQQVDLFEAVKAGDIVVKVIPKDVKEANILIENKTKQPLTIKLPEAFAGVPVLAQPGMMGGGMGGNVGGGGGGGGQQGFGGGMGGMGGGMMGGMGGGMGGGGMGGGFFNVAPEKVGKIKVPIVCLEHGKTDPNPRVAYELRPIDTFTKDQRVVEVCKMLGYNQVARNTAQAAVWHLANGLEWNELANKDRVRLSNGYTEKYFSQEEIVAAMRISQEASRRADENKPSEGEKYDSLSQK
jgi:hypothetical protein